ncbi:MAG: hypothetical protein U0790_29255 [Isosphaeraceae bacterium]
MIRRFFRCLSFVAAFCLVPGAIAAGREESSPRRELAPSLAPLEYLIGRWTGQGVPKDDPALRFRGWTETHTWAWVFEQGRAVALSVRVQGGRSIREGTLSFDPTRQRYRLDVRPSAEAGTRRTYIGRLENGGKLLMLESTVGAATDRITLRANANHVRYSLTVERRDAGGVRFDPRMEVGLTREGESLAAGAAATERPRCVVTGGAASMTVSHCGQDYPICCTGCRDGFSENPEKYLKKLASRTPAAGGQRKDPPRPTSKVNRFEDAFAEDVPDGAPGSPAASQPSTEARQDAAAGAPRPRTDGDAGPTPPRRQGGRGTSARAATALRLAENLEKSGSRSAALNSYRNLLRDFPGSPQARKAAELIRALESR